MYDYSQTYKGRSLMSYDRPLEWFKRFYPGVTKSDIAKAGKALDREYLALCERYQLKFNEFFWAAYGRKPTSEDLKTFGHYDLRFSDEQKTILSAMLFSLMHLASIRNACFKAAKI